MSSAPFQLSTWAQAAQEAERTTGAASNSTSTDIVLMLSSVDSAGTPMSAVYISPRNRVAADVLVVSPQDMPTVVAHLCKPFDPGSAARHARKDNS